MPVNFLSKEQHEKYGKYPEEEVSEKQLSKYFHLDNYDLMIVNKHQKAYLRFGFAIQLCTIRFLGTFLATPTNVPENVILYIGKQIDIKKFGCLQKYENRKNTHYEHTKKIKESYGYKGFYEEPGHSELFKWLNTRIWLNDERPSILFDLATSWLVERKIILPGATTLTRTISKIRDKAKENLWQKVASIPNQEQKEKLEELFDLDLIKRKSKLDQLRCGPTRVSGNALIKALNRLEEIRSFNMSNIDLSGIPHGRFQELARYAMTCWSSRINRMPKDRRTATLVAFIYYLEEIALDDALNVFDMFMSDAFKKAKSNAEKEKIRTSRDLDAAAISLSEACQFIIDESCNGKELRKIIFASIPKTEIEDAISQVKNLAKYDDLHYQEMIQLYGKIRRFLSIFLRTINFEGTISARPLLRAIRFLKNIENKWEPDISKAPLEGISETWLQKIITGSYNKKIDRNAYTLCILQWLQDSLQRRDIFCERSERWSDPRIKLLNGQEWENVKYEMCHTLGREQDPNKELEKLTENLDKAYQQTIKNLPFNEDVRLEKQNGKQKMVLRNLDKQEEPESLLKLSSVIDQRLPVVDLPEILLEIHNRTGFASEFTHITESQSRIKDLHITICAVLLAEACNIGFEPIARKDHPALTMDRLLWVQQNYIRTSTLANANAKLVEAQTQIPLAQKWGGGHVASADGLRFVSSVHTVNSGANPKYFNAKRGITYYNFSSDQFTGFHGIVIPGTLRDSLFILQGLLEQQTILRPTEIMADTAGVSNIIFGLFWLLGFQFSPRLADIKDSSLFILDPNADYGVLSNLHTLNPKKIIHHWEDMLRIAGSLKLGKIKSSDLLQSILKSKKPSQLAQAIGDLGKISKTIYMLNYFDDKSYRRRILTQLNRGEGRNMLARKICYGKLGQIGKRYKQGQEDQLGVLGLVTNVIVLWQTMYMDAICKQLKQETEVAETDIARLSPLRHKNINVLGRYSFTLDESITNGQLRANL